MNLFGIPTTALAFAFIPFAFVIFIVLLVLNEAIDSEIRKIKEEDHAHIKEEEVTHKQVHSDQGLMMVTSRSNGRGVQFLQNVADSLFEYKLTAVKVWDSIRGAINIS